MFHHIWAFDVYYEAVTDLMFSLLLLIVRPISYDCSVHWCVASRATAATQHAGLDWWWCWWQKGVHGIMFSGNLKSIDQS